MYTGSNRLFFLMCSSMYMFCHCKLKAGKSSPLSVYFSTSTMSFHEVEPHLHSSPDVEYEKNTQFACCQGHIFLLQRALKASACTHPPKIEPISEPANICFSACAHLAVVCEQKTFASLRCCMFPSAISRDISEYVMPWWRFGMSGCVNIILKYGKLVHRIFLVIISYTFLRLDSQRGWYHLQNGSA